MKQFLKTYEGVKCEQNFEIYVVREPTSPSRLIQLEAWWNPNLEVKGCLQLQNDNDNNKGIESDRLIDERAIVSLDKPSKFLHYHCSQLLYQKSTNNNVDVDSKTYDKVFFHLVFQQF